MLGPTQAQGPQLPTARAIEEVAATRDACSPNETTSWTLVFQGAHHVVKKKSESVSTPPPGPFVSYRLEAKTARAAVPSQSARIFAGRVRSRQQRSSVAERSPFVGSARWVEPENTERPGVHRSMRSREEPERRRRTRTRLPLATSSEGSEDLRQDPSEGLGAALVHRRACGSDRVAAIVPRAIAVERERVSGCVIS